jgi:hypothetical protein
VCVLLGDGRQLLSESGWVCVRVSSYYILATESKVK